MGSSPLVGCLERLKRRPGIQQRRHDGGPSSRRRLGDGKFDVTSGGIRKLRTQQSNSTCHEGRRGTCPSQGQWFALCAETGHPIYAAKRGVLVIVAAGNQGMLGSTAITRHPWALPVVAYDLHGRPTEHSNLGGSIGRRGIGAPGSRAASTVRSPFVVG